MIADDIRNMMSSAVASATDMLDTTLASAVIVVTVMRKGNGVKIWSAGDSAAVVKVTEAVRSAFPLKGPDSPDTNAHVNPTA